MDSKKRFSKIVSYYIKYRPGYPDAIIQFMQDELGLKGPSVIADIGSGTGKLSELFLRNRNRLIGVEPNAAMRGAAEELWKTYPAFESRDGTAENTGLPDQSVDFIVAGQAFHWFDLEESRLEFKRIIRPGGFVLLIWNKRIDDKSSFMKDYNEFLQVHSTDLKTIDLRNISTDHFLAFFGSFGYDLVSFEHYQTFNFEGLVGRYLSSSYAFDKEHPQHVNAMKTLEGLYLEHQNEDHVKMWYRTEVYYSQW